jgi:hypothetical protein
VAGIKPSADKLEFDAMKRAQAFVELRFCRITKIVQPRVVSDARTLPRAENRNGSRP